MNWIWIVLKYYNKKINKFLETIILDYFYDIVSEILNFNITFTFKCFLIATCYGDYRHTVVLCAFHFLSG